MGRRGPDKDFVTKEIEVRQELVKPRKPGESEFQIVPETFSGTVCLIENIKIGEGTYYLSEGIYVMSQKKRWNKTMCCGFINKRRVGFCQRIPTKT